MRRGAVTKPCAHAGLCGSQAERADRPFRVPAGAAGGWVAPVEGGGVTQPPACWDESGGNLGPRLGRAW
jgi:hypothetical protein